MPVADTSFLVALRNPEDDHHARALELAQSPGPFVVPAVILAEFLSVVWAHRRRLSVVADAHAAARAALTAIEAQPVFAIETHYDAETAADVYRDHPRLSYPDAVAIAVARSQDEGIFTFDGEQRKAAAQGGG